MLYKKYEYKGQIIGVAAEGFGPKIWRGYFEVQHTESTFGNSLPLDYESKEHAMDAALAEGRAQVDAYVPIRTILKRPG